MTNREFEEVYYPKYKDAIAALARRFEHTDASLVEDLEQEGAIALWSLDLRRVKKNEASYIKQAVAFRMVDFLRKERPARFESLDAELLSWVRMEVDEDTGLLRIVRNGVLSRGKVTDEEE